MNAPSLTDLASAAGLCSTWTDVNGQTQRVADATLAEVLRSLGLPSATAAQRREAMHQALGNVAPSLRTGQVQEWLDIGAVEAACEWQHEDGSVVPARTDAAGSVQAPGRPGYWLLRQGNAEVRVAVAPPRCFGVSHALGPNGRGWGLVLQAYAARGELDAGMGDTAACGEWAWRAAGAGADALALGPVHAAGAIDAGFSPYSPSDRRFLEPLYGAPIELPGDIAREVLASDPDLRGELERLGRADYIDWPATAAAKWRWLARTHRACVQAMPEALADLQRHERDGGPALAAHVAFMHARHGHNPAVYLFAQWLATRGWQRVHDGARRAGMKVGLIADLAIGFDPHGAEAHAAGDTALRGLLLGAPPDPFSAAGQVWGITSYSPTGLASRGFMPFIQLLRAVMHDRGGIRIDHILGLQRLWVVPEGADAGEGAYLHYPVRDLLNLVAIESWRQRCIVIGEDLGLVSQDIRSLLARRGVLGTDVLAFCRDTDGAFLPPEAWRCDAVAMTGTHDLPTLVGWRRGRDLHWRERLGQLEPSALRHEQAQRRHEVAQLDRVLPIGPQKDAAAVRLAALRHVASSAAPLALVPVEDALGLEEQVNLPGTVDQHPNWRRRLPHRLGGASLQEAMACIAEVRRKSSP